MADETFQSLAEVTERLERVLAASPADETELVWLQRRRGAVDRHGRGGVDALLTSILVRVVEGGRLGWYRTEAADSNELENGVRQALALGTVQPRVKKRPVFLDRRGGAGGVRLARDVVLRDPELEGFEPAAAAARLEPLCRQRETATLGWTASRLAIFNSHGLRRTAAATEVSLQVAVDPRPGGGRAAASARTLEGLDAEAVFARARAVHGDGKAAKAPQGGVAVVLAPEAAIVLLDVVNGYAFSGRAYLDGTSFLSQHRNIQVFDRLLNLRDDGTSADGLPFPFDLEGAAKQPLDLIVEGKPSTPALNRHQGLEAGLKPTGQAVGGEDSLFGNLFLLPGDSGAPDLFQAADGGLWIGWLEPPQCLEPSHLQVRLVARGVRRIEGGRLGAAVPDLMWEGSILRVLARLRAVGDTPVVRSTGTTPFGAISAPALVLEEVEGFAALPGSGRRRRGQSTERRNKTTV